MALSKINFYRILDANFNRGKEGLRVCEDICRFVLNKKSATKQYKQLRHQLTDIVGKSRLKRYIAARDIEYDVGKESLKIEFDRKGLRDIFFANSQRVKESLRVLEEFSKLLDSTGAQKFKMLRYEVYALEKKVSVK